MEVKVKKTGYKLVKYDVVSFKWLKPVSEKLQSLKCTACKSPIGDKRWGLAWVEKNGKRQAMRLCESCGIEADKEQGSD